MSNPLWQPVGVKDGVEGLAGRSGRAAPGKEIRLMKFKRFTKPLWLRSVGRAALTQVFGRFAGELAQRGKALPPAHLDDDAWLSALGFLLLAPESLPDELNDTLFVIEEMATTEGHDQLLAAAQAAGLTLDLGDEATPGDVAIRVWLQEPELLIRQHARSRVERLSAFQYFGARQPRAARAISEEFLAGMTADLDAWFRTHNRGHKTTRIDLHPLDGEMLFVLRHGDPYRRTAKVVHGRLEALHFRPAKDDLVVYSPRRDEIRVHAGTKGEKEMYRVTFGKWLHGGLDHFCQRQAYTLEPLQTEGLDALKPGPVAGITRVHLREVELSWVKGFKKIEIHKAKCVLHAAHSYGRTDLLTEAHLVRAVFEVRFADIAKGRRVEIRPPNTLKMSRQCNASVVHRWLSERGFRTAEAGHPLPEVTHE